MPPLDNICLSKYLSGKYRRSNHARALLQTRLAERRKQRRLPGEALRRPHDPGRRAALRVARHLLHGMAGTRVPGAAAAHLGDRAERPDRTRHGRPHPRRGLTRAARPGAPPAQPPRSPRGRDRHHSGRTAPGAQRQACPAGAAHPAGRAVLAPRDRHAHLAAAAAAAAPAGGRGTEAGGGVRCRAQAGGARRTAPPQAQAAPRRQTPAPTATRSVTYGADVADGWYGLFHSDNLDRLVRMALAGNPDLEAARHGLKAAQYELQAVAGTQLPQIDATGQIARAHLNGSYFYGPLNALDVTGNQFELGPELAYNLDPFGQTRRQVESQRAATAVARDQALNTYVTLVDQTVITAFDYAAAQAQIEVTRALADELESQYQLTSTLENAGKITRSDTLQAQTQLENLRATLPGLEQQRDTYRNALAQLC